MTEHRADSMTGAVIDSRYEIRARLARGGMSTVYLAVDQRLDREVALKVLYPHLAENPELVDRFEQEAKTAARLSHPHVVNVLDQGVDEDPDGLLAYLVIEYVPGYTLRTVLQRRRAMTPRVALAYLEAIVDGLAAAHRGGLVHRDMKPENVLVSRDGRIKVADFGLARATTNHTAAGTSLVGTVAYISPELVRGAPADERSDIYAVGIMAFEMLTGRQPFTGTSPIQIAYQHVNDEVPAPSSEVPGLADELDQLVAWCTASEASGRPADAGVLLTEIRHLRATLADEDLDLEPPAAADGPAEWQEGADRDAADAAGDLGDADATDVIRTGQPTEVIGRGGATEVIRPGRDAEALDPGATTVLPPSGSQHTSVLPSLPPESGEGSSGMTAPRSHVSSGGRLPVRAPRPARPHSARRQRREANRRARTPTEDLGRRSRTRVWVFAAVVLIAAAVLVLAGWFFGSGPGALVVVPDVEGHSRASAVDALEQTGVGYSLASVHHDVVAEDSVIATEPEPGTEVRRFNTVLVTVSLGPEMFRVPDVSGLDREATEAELQEAELSLGRTSTEYSDAVEAGRVIRQDPAAGEQLRRNHPVSVVVSDGPEPVAVPDLTGLTVEEAEARLSDLGLRLEVAGSEHSAEVEAGRIGSQDPADGEEVSPGAEVSVTESLGPVMVEVPDVTGQAPDSARQALEDAGFEVEETEVLGDFFGDRDGTVRRQTPEPGNSVPEGSTVRLLIL